MEEKERISHESFGQIYFGRTLGHAKFYGSELEQDHYITMEVRESEVERDLSKEWYYNRKQILKLRMTSGQFSELITSLNNGSGVPCTLEYILDKKIAPLPEVESRKELVHRKFKDRMKIFADKLIKNQIQAKEIVKKKTLSKENIQDLTNHLNWLTTEIKSNIPFFMECFQETMDEVVFEAKTEVENAIQHKINVLGLKNLHEQNKLLEG